MYPAPFQYHRAKSVEDAVQMLTNIGEGARVLAGGQSYLAILKLRFDEPTDLVDIGRIPNLDQIDDSGDTVSIGALATHNRIAASSVAASVPIVSDCANGIADNQVIERSLTFSAARPRNRRLLQTHGECLGYVLFAGLNTRSYRRGR